MKYASYVIWNNGTMEKESEDSHGYNKLKCLYETGLHKIFDAREIEQEKTGICERTHTNREDNTELDTFIDRIYMLLKDEEEEK